MWISSWLKRRLGNQPGERERKSHGDYKNRNHGRPSLSLNMGIIKDPTHAVRTSTCPWRRTWKGGKCYKPSQRHLPHHKPTVPPDNTSHQIPIPLRPDPIANHNPRPSIPMPPVVRMMLRTKPLHRRRVTPPGNPLGPAPHLPKVARA